MVCFPTYYTLSFSGTTVGDKLIGYLPSFKRLTQIYQRQNYWSPQVILDGRYPALVWEHSFTLYKEHPNLEVYLQSFVNFYTQITANPVPLKISTSMGTVIGSLGNCYFEDIQQTQPELLLQYAAGIFQLRFIGNTAPLITPISTLTFP